MASLIFAILSPIFWAVMNLLDKLIVDKKVVHLKSFMGLTGLLNICIGLILFFVADWTQVNVVHVILTIISGTLYGFQAIMYYELIAKQDASDVIGLTYTYLFILAVLGAFFLQENISVIGYIGTSIAMFGAILLTTKVKKLQNKQTIFLLVLTTLNIAIQEFILKLASQSISTLQSISLNTLFLGVVLVSLLIVPSTRIHVSAELKNLKYAFVSEVLTACAIGSMFIALLSTPVTMVATIGALQPIILLILERVFSRWHPSILDKNLLKHKYIGSFCIVFGIILLVNF